MEPMSKRVKVRKSILWISCKTSQVPVSFVIYYLWKHWLYE